MCCTHTFENEKLTYSTVKIGSLLSLERFFLERYSRECKPIVVIVPSPSGYVDFNPATPSVSWHLEKGEPISILGVKIATPGAMVMPSSIS